jgi:hypothetical protein
VPSYYDPETGEVGQQFAAATQQAQQLKSSKSAALQVTGAFRQLTEAQTSTTIRPLWVYTQVPSEQPRLMACADADLGALAPDGSAVAYRSQGSAWVSELKSYPLAEFKAMLAKAGRQTAINNAKQVGLAAIIFAGNNGEVLPGPDRINDISQYLDDQRMLNGFNYTYPGGPLADIASPSTTELGTVDGPGGQAIIYADGHVKWRDQ